MQGAALQALLHCWQYKSMQATMHGYTAANTTGYSMAQAVVQLW
jgi:hypothetical protein